MPATTPKLALPYPLGTDPVQRGDDDIRALALALDGTTWVDLPLINSWTATTGALTPQYRRDGVGNVHLRGNIQNGVAAAFGQLPAGFRPTQDLTIAAPGNAVGSVGILAVLTTGDLTLANKVGTAPGFALHIVFSVVAVGVLRSADRPEALPFPGGPEHRPTERNRR